MREVRDHRKSNAAVSGRVDAVRDISLEMEAGQFLAVVGRSGSGKSTLLAMVGGLCHPTLGEVRPRIAARFGLIDRRIGELPCARRCRRTTAAAAGVVVWQEPFVIGPGEPLFDRGHQLRLTRRTSMGARCGRRP